MFFKTVTFLFICVATVSAIPTAAAAKSTSTCPKGYDESIYDLGYCYYFSTIVASFTESVRYCHSKNGDIVWINNYRENLNVAELANQKVGVFQKFSEAWIGFTNMDYSKDYYWIHIDGKVNESMITANSANREENLCGAIKYRNDESWTVDRCDNDVVKPFVCKIPVENAKKNYKSKTPTNNEIISSMLAQGRANGCPPSYVPAIYPKYRNYCYYVSSFATSFTESVRACKSDNSALTTINQYSENLDISTNAKVYIESFAELLPDNAWIGLTNMGKNYYYWNVDGRQPNFTSWDVNISLNEADQCTSLKYLHDNTWITNSCSNKVLKPFICKYHIGDVPIPEGNITTDITQEPDLTTTTTTPSTTTTTTPTTTITTTIPTTTTPYLCPLEGFKYFNNGFCYKAFPGDRNGMNFEERCQNLHSDAHLASIHSRTIETELFYMAEEAKDETGYCYAIGLTVSPRKKFAWTDDSKVDYLNFKSGVLRDTTCGCVRLCAHLEDTCVWDVAVCDDLANGYICQVPSNSTVV